MFDTILVPLDGTYEDEIALPVAIDQALRQNARLVLMYTAIRPEPCESASCNGGPMAPPMMRRESQSECSECQEAERYLDDIQQRHHLFGETELVVRHGDPVRQIVTEIAGRPRPMVIMAATIEPDCYITAQEDRARRLLATGVCQVMLITRQPEPLQCCANEIVVEEPVYAGMAM
jgi:nucleotide-binding universal stress UspA family protein